MLRVGQCPAGHGRMLSLVKGAPRSEWLIWAPRSASMSPGGARVRPGHAPLENTTSCLRNYIGDNILFAGLLPLTIRMC